MNRETDVLKGNPGSMKNPFEKGVEETAVLELMGQNSGGLC